jgi:hypothetical protein
LCIHHQEKPNGLCTIKFIKCGGGMDNCPYLFLY